MDMKQLRGTKVRLTADATPTMYYTGSDGQKWWTFRLTGEPTVFPRCVGCGVILESGFQRGPENVEHRCGNCVIFGDYEKTFVIGNTGVGNLLRFTVKLTADGVFTMSHTTRWSAGQGCDEALKEVTRWKMDRVKVYRMIAVWKRWHLNDLRAGCEHQRAEGWHERVINNGPNRGKRAADFYPSEGDAGYPVPRTSTDPEGLLCKPCPVCGYRYGTKWLKEELPAEVVTEILSW